MSAAADDPAADATPHGATPSGWRPRDCHAHTTWSDGALIPAALVGVAHERGVKPSVADHCSRDVGLAVKDVDTFRRYLAALEEVREREPDLAVSGEFCWHDAFWRDLPAALWARLDHAVGSLHAIHLDGGARQHMFARHWPAGLTGDAYMDAHVADLERFAREMPVDILAHPTLLPLPLRGRPLEELWTEPREARAVAALAAAGVAFEVSNRYRPHERFVRRAVDAGVRLALGSDGHAPQAVGDLAWPLALARHCGARDEDLYDPAVHGRRAPA